MRGIPFLRPFLFALSVLLPAAVHTFELRNSDIEYSTVPGSGIIEREHTMIIGWELASGPFRCGLSGGGTFATDGLSNPVSISMAYESIVRDPGERYVNPDGAVRSISVGTAFRYRFGITDGKPGIGFSARYVAAPRLTFQAGYDAEHEVYTTGTTPSTMRSQERMTGSLRGGCSFYCWAKEQPVKDRNRYGSPRSLFIRPEASFVPAMPERYVIDLMIAVPLTKWFAVGFIQTIIHDYYYTLNQGVYFPSVSRDLEYRYSHRYLALWNY